MRIFILALATGGGSGYAPVASGTFGSAVGLLVWLAISGFGPIAYALGVLAVVLVGTWAADRAQTILQRHDDGRITIDEVAGMLVSLAWLPTRPEVVLSAFLLFRLFDIWKPPPAGAAERLPGGVGVMADDLVAGVYANLAGQLLWRVAFPGRRSVSAVPTRDGVWVITIGDELLRGEIVDSNKSHLSERMLALDLESARHVSVPDDPDAIEEVLRQAASRARVVLVSGGLGPTRDDITTEIAAKTFGLELYRDEAALEHVRAFFRRFNREMAENNAKQADFPKGAVVLANPLGTAPGFMLEVPDSAGGEATQLFFMPGVPRELYRMLDEEVMPRISARLGRGRVVRARLLRTFGIGESNLDRVLHDIAQNDADAVLGFRTQFPDNLVRVLVRAEDEASAGRRLDELEREIRARLGELVLGAGERPMEEIVAELLREQKRTIAVAESITGGLISSRLTDVPGSSAYLLAAFITYANDAKVRELGVDPAVLARDGAVSEAVARQMAEGARRRAGTDIGLATTGVAGPDGGSPEKPVGTVWLALADSGGTIAHRYQMMAERRRNKDLASQLALDWLRRRLLGLPITADLFPRLSSAGEKRA